MLRPFIEFGALKMLSETLFYMYQVFFCIILLILLIVFWEKLRALAGALAQFIHTIHKLHHADHPTLLSFFRRIISLLSVTGLKETVQFLWKRIRRFIVGAIISFNARFIVSLLFYSLNLGYTPATVVVTSEFVRDVKEDFESNFPDTTSLGIPQSWTENETNTVMYIMGFWPLYVLLLVQLLGFFLTLSFGNRYFVNLTRGLMILTIFIMLLGVLYSSYAITIGLDEIHGIGLNR